MADPLKPVSRPSLNVTDEEKYLKGGDFALGAGQKAGKGTYTPKGDLASLYGSAGNFGMGAKTAGKPKLSHLTSPSDKDTEFQTLAKVGVTTYTKKALDYASGQYKVDTKKYNA
jgi:hypothetical protein